MKKLFGIISAAVILASAMVFSGCSAEDEEVLAPTETWVEKEYSYTDESGNSSQLTCYFMFTEKGYANSNLKNVPEASKNGSATTIKPGMTVVIVPSAKAKSPTAGTIAETLSTTKFICKTFPLGTQTVKESDSDTKGFSFEMTKAKWNVFYYANIASFMKNDQLKNPPVPLKTSGYTELTDFSNFSWKKLLANYLLGTL